MKNFIAGCLCFFLVGSIFAQDQHFSQFYASPLGLNPAFAGTTYAPRISANYRNEWPAVTNIGVAYSTFAVSYEQFVPEINSGIGLMLMSDDAGDGLLKLTNFLAAYAYKIEVNDDFQIKIGIEAGFRQYNLDWDKLVFLDQIDQIQGPILPTNEIQPDVLNNTIFDTPSRAPLLLSVHRLTTLLWYACVFSCGQGHSPIIDI